MSFAGGDAVVDTASIADNAVTPAKMSQSGTVGQVMTSGGAGVDPAYATASTVDLTDIGTSVISDTDNTDDMGTAAKAWKDLYLAGGIYIGGTTSANYLTDYEEGSWTPVIGGDVSTSGQTYGTQYGSYTKIGNLVHVNFHAILTAKGTITGTAQIQGLPFASVNTSGHAASVAMGYHDYTVPSGYGTAIGHLTLNATGITLYSTRDSGGPLAVTTTHLANDSRFAGTLMYEV